VSEPIHNGIAPQPTDAQPKRNSSRPWVGHICRLDNFNDFGGIVSCRDIIRGWAHALELAVVNPFLTGQTGSDLGINLGRTDDLQNAIRALSRRVVES
jgi:hypothetical protein